MRAAGLFVALAGVAGIVLGLMAMFGVHFLQPTASVGDVRMPGAGPIIAGVIMLAAGTCYVRRRMFLGRRDRFSSDSGRH